MSTINHDDLIDYLGGELSPERYIIVRDKLKEDASLRKELETLRQLRDAVGEEVLPTPSAAADRRFADLLTAHARPGRPAPRKLLPLRPRAIIGIAATVLLLVFATGWYLGSSNTGTLERELAATRTLMLELMESGESTTRMRAATVSLEAPVADPVIIGHLGQMLRADKNTNVRLAALGALRRFAGDPLARDEMLAAMATDQPIGVRVEVMETLIRMREPRVVPYLQEIMTNDSLPRPLRDAAELGTFKLI